MVPLAAHECNPGMAAVSALLLAPAAFATTVGIAFDNVGISAGPGANMTLPGGKLSVAQGFGSGYALSGNFVGAGGKNDATFYGARVEFSKALPLWGGKIVPGLAMGFNSLNVGPVNAEAAYGGFRVAYRYPVTRWFHLEANGGFGRDFATSVTDISTIGGLTYNAGAQADFHVGPGWLDAGYQYRHLPLSTAYDLHLDTAQFTIGYHLMF